MAKNLRAKIPASDTLIIRDINEDAMKRFVAESQEAARSTGAGAGESLVEIAENAREVAEKSVWFVPGCGSGPLWCSRCAPIFIHRLLSLLTLFWLYRK